MNTIVALYPNKSITSPLPLASRSPRGLQKHVRPARERDGDGGVQARDVEERGEAQVDRGGAVLPEPDLL